MGSLTQDVKLALRKLFKRKGFTLAVVLSMALGIGANTTIFSVVNAALLRPLPYPGGERLISHTRSSNSSEGQA